MDLGLTSWYGPPLEDLYGPDSSVARQLSPFILPLVMDNFKTDVQDDVHCCMLFVDDVLIS